MAAAGADAEKWYSLKETGAILGEKLHWSYGDVGRKTVDKWRKKGADVTGRSDKVVLPSQEFVAGHPKCSATDIDWFVSQVTWPQ